MASAALLEQARLEAWSDEHVVSRVLAGDSALYELLMRRYNQRLYRVARAILRNDAEAEDVMQDAYVRAYQHLADFEGRAKFSTWLTRIAVNEALARSRGHSRFQSLDNSEESKGGVMGSLASAGRNPEESAYDRELGGVLEQAILKLPEDHRLVFMLRDVEGMSTDETAECLNLSPENVKVRLHRARAGLRKNRMLAHSDGRFCLGSMLLQPLRYKLLYIGLAGSNIFAAFLLCELSKVKKQRQPPIYDQARVAVRFQPFQVALYLRSQPTGTDSVDS